MQVCLLVPADLWQIFAGLASRAIARDALFERRARVCGKSNQYAAQPNQENQQVAGTSGEIALDVESLPCANGCSEVLKPNLAVWKCFVDQESGAHTTLQTGILLDNIFLGASQKRSMVYNYN